jgi:hypothetical protein
MTDEQILQYPPGTLFVALGNTRETELATGAVFRLVSHQRVNDLYHTYMVTPSPAMNEKGWEEGEPFYFYAEELRPTMPEFMQLTPC